MRRILLSVVLSGVMIGCGSSDEVTTTGTVEVEPPVVEFTDADRKLIADYFISDEEPKVIDATWTLNSMFKIGVNDDGTSRDGLAKYACNIINLDFNGKGQNVTVQVIDYPKLMSTKEWVKLGEAQCYK